MQRVAFTERRLQVGDFAAVGHALDCFHAAAVALHREHQATAHDRAVDAHRAGAAHAVLAAHVAAGELQLLAQEIDQVLSRLDLGVDALAVDRESYANAIGHVDESS